MADDLAVKAAGDRARRIRKWVEAGKDVSDDDRAFLAAHVPGRPGRKAKASGGDVEVDAPPGSPRDAAAESVAPEFTVDAEAPAPEAPRVKPRDPGRGKAPAGKAGPWQAKYRGGASGEREATCLEIAGVWRKGMLKANAKIRDNGVTPAVPDDLIETLFPCAVLTADRVLPDGFSVGPEIQVVVSTSLATGQLLYSSRKAKQREAADEKTRRSNAAWVNPNPDPPPDETPPTPGTNGKHAMSKAPALRDENTVF